MSNCHQLKLKSSDGKCYNTDVCDIEGMFRIIQSIPSKNAEPIKEWSGMIAKEYKQYKGLRKESLRDNMTDIEVARKGGKIAGNARRDLENEIGESVITDNNALTYEYVDKKEIEMK